MSGFQTKCRVCGGGRFRPSIAFQSVEWWRVCGEPRQKYDPATDEAALREWTAATLGRLEQKVEDAFKTGAIGQPRWLYTNFGSVGSSVDLPVDSAKPEVT